MSSSYGKAVGGKLKLKGISLSGSSSAKAAGVKRPREDDAPSSRSNSSSSSSSSASSISSSNSASTQAQRIQGSGTIITSGTTLHGIDTKFLAELSIGDAIQIINPVSGKDEVKVVKMVLSDKSAGINAPFSTDLVSGAAFHILKLPKAAVDPATLAAQAAEKARQEEQAAFGKYAGEGGTKLTYLAKKEGVHKGYKMVTETVAKPLTREEMLDMRAKHKSDKFC